mgnify:CR=1 FL=1
MRKLAIAIVIGTGLSLSACGVKDMNRSVNSVHQPVVERAQYAIDLNLDPRQGVLPQELQRLDQWMQVMDVGYGDQIALDFGGGYGNKAAADAIGRVAARRGLLLSDYAPVTGQAFAPGTVRVVVTRSTAYVPGCPDWSKKSESEFWGATHTNYGCATNSNMAVMVADPEDLISGQDAGGANTRAGVRAVQTFNDGGAEKLSGGGGVSQP